MNVKLVEYDVCELARLSFILVLTAQLNNSLYAG